MTAADEFKDNIPKFKKEAAEEEVLLLERAGLQALDPVFKMGYNEGFILGRIYSYDKELRDTWDMVREAAFILLHASKQDNFKGLTPRFNTFKTKFIEKCNEHEKIIFAPEELR